LNSLDPATAYFIAEREITQLVFPPLVTLDARLQPAEWAAERHEISADGLIYTFHLRPGMHWSDGAPIDATTFAWSINRGLDPCLNSFTAYYIYLSVIKGSEAFYDRFPSARRPLPQGRGSARSLRSSCSPVGEKNDSVRREEAPALRTRNRAVGPGRPLRRERSGAPQT
jgi:hypothetical protein